MLCREGRALLALTQHLLPPRLSSSGKAQSWNFHASTLWDGRCLNCQAPARDGEELFFKLSLQCLSTLVPAPQKMQEGGVSTRASP